MPDKYERFMQAVESDFEAEVVEEVAIRAGLLWRCQAPIEDKQLALYGRPCYYVNPESADKCEECGASRCGEEWASVIQAKTTGGPRYDMEQEV